MSGGLSVIAVEGSSKRPPIKIGQIGIGHNHGAAKMEALRKLEDDFEVVGVVEPDPAWREMTPLQ